MAIAAIMAACSGANNANVNSNGNANVRNINVSRPETSPQTSPVSGVPANTTNANGPRPTIGRMPPGMANEKMTQNPGDKRVPPQMLGTPIKKPSP